MNTHYEYGKTNLLQSLENARTFASYLDDADSELRQKIDNAIGFFKHSVELILKEYENEKEN